MQTYTKKMVKQPIAYKKLSLSIFEQNFKINSHERETEKIFPKGKRDTYTLV